MMTNHQGLPEYICRVSFPRPTFFEEPNLVPMLGHISEPLIHLGSRKSCPTGLVGKQNHPGNPSMSTLEKHRNPCHFFEVTGLRIVLGVSSSWKLTAICFPGIVV